MHGVSRKAPTQEEKEASALKAAKLGELQSQLLHFHRNKIYTKDAVDISRELLESNPEHYTGWNYRKLVVQQLLETASDSDSTQSILEEELRLVQRALQRNYKSYGAWHHRKWILSKGHSSTDFELELLKKFQKLDARNFHAWNYRRFIKELKNVPDEKELKYTKDMIDDNFSNYSAWHNRSMLLSHQLDAKENGSHGKETVLEQEFDYVHQAIFTEPDDQSGWFFSLWLLDQTIKREPLLLSSWPLLDSKLYLSVNDFSDCSSSLQILNYKSEDRKFPVILYFSEPVEGVSSSTVTVESEYQAADNFIWRPLSVIKSGFSQAWFTYLNFPDEVNSSKTYTVNVTVAQYPGIKSPRGISSGTSHVSFTVCVPSHDQKRTMVKTSPRIFWNEVMSKSDTSESEDTNLLNALGKLKIIGENRPTASEWSIKTISEEISLFRELLSMTSCKIGKLTLARLLTAHDALISYGRPNDGTGFQYEEILALYNDLMKMDTSHSSYYEDEYSLALWKQVTSNMDSLLKYITKYQDATSSPTKSCLCLRLSNLSFSRLGSMECLLWVQMLDLSHNKLRSIEGLETLQQLSRLNLSNNNICSFLALDPLRILKRLEVLNISYNEIGAHSIDTRRYLCSSPLTNTVGNDWDFHNFATGNIKRQDHWDAFLIFTDSNLRQLDIVGNAVVDDYLKAFLVKLIPTLEWLDSDSCS